MGDLQVWVPILCHGHDDWMIWVSPMFWTPPYSVGKTMPFLPPIFLGMVNIPPIKMVDFFWGMVQMTSRFTQSLSRFTQSSGRLHLRHFLLQVSSQAVGWLSRDMDCGDFTKHFKWVIIGILWENPIFLW